VPIGYLVTTALAALCTVFALAPPRPRQSSRSNRSFWLGFLVNELPFILFYCLLASTLLALAQDDLDSPVGWVAFGVAVVTTPGLALVAWRGLQAGPALDRALSEGLGSGWMRAVDPGLATRLRRRLPLGRILFAPFFMRRRDVIRVADVSYGDAGPRNLLDVYHQRSRPSGGPILVYLHGGAFRSGRKNREARPLLFRLASQGWVCISANYRLSPAATFPDHLIDVKKVIAWARKHGSDYGADTGVLFTAGSSAGGHLASMAALTPNDARFQPGFERADTSVTAAIALCGYFGSVSSKDDLPSSPLAYVERDAPPFFVAHGDRDTVVIVEDARRFVERLRRGSSQSVVYAELPGAQHAFDLFHSLRFEQVVDAVEAFTAWVRSRSTAANPAGWARSSPTRR
jgi:acetyl esterase/lipase